ncbi:hypothetical protein J4Z08_20995 [Citrobacter portucalensis]|uniref:hypothetical protein n=1 Tax=Citrobacter portucalensis TaxID=1639133 RepID=UPI003140A52B
MANWHIPVPQLRVMRRMAAGEKLKRDIRTGRFIFDNGDRVTSQGKALFNKGWICEGFPGTETVNMNITPTGRNELGYNRHREID